MTQYSLGIFSLADFSGDTSIIDQFWTGAQWSWNAWMNPEITLTTDIANTATIHDSDLLFSDDDFGQTLVTDLVLNGVTYAAGSTIEDEYEASFTGSDGLSYTLVAVSINGAIVGVAFDGPTPPSGTTLTYAGGENYQDVTSMVPCFLAGTLIDTPSGPRRVESLRPGDLVLTLDHGPQVLRWSASSHIRFGHDGQNDKHRPVVIRAGALGNGTPLCDVTVSPQHRILLRSAGIELALGTAEVFLSAKLAVNGQSIRQDHLCTRAVYVHLLFDHHEVVTTSGLESESFFPGDQATTALNWAARISLAGALERLAHARGHAEYGETARYVANRHEATLIRALMPKGPLHLAQKTAA